MIDKISKVLLRLRNRHFIIDAIAFLITPVLVLTLRLGHFNRVSILYNYGFNLILITIFFLVIKLTVLYRFGFYRRCWRNASIDELSQIAMLTAAAIVLESIVLYALNHWVAFSVKDLPRSLPLVDGILSFIFLGGLRFSILAVDRVSQQRTNSAGSERLLIVGAGNAGVSIVRQMQQNPQHGLYPIALINDNPTKLRLRIRGLPVVGDRHKIPEFVRFLHIRRVIIAMPSASGKVLREILDICQSIGVPTSTLPGIHELLNGCIGVESIRDIATEKVFVQIQQQIDQVLEVLRKDSKAAGYILQPYYPHS